MSTFNVNNAIWVYAGRTLTSLRGDGVPPFNREDQMDAKGVGGGGVVHVTGTDETGEATLPLVETSADNAWLIDVFNRLKRGEKVNGKRIPVLTVRSLDTGASRSMPCRPKKIPETTYAGYGNAAGDPPVSEWSMVGGPVTTNQNFTPDV